jgi:glutamine synthetase
MNKAEAFNIIQKHGIDYVGLMFTDFQGKLYTVWICSSEMEGAIKNGVGFSGYPYFSGHTDSDLTLKPDMSTFRVLPWLSGGKAMGAVMADMFRVNGVDPLEESPRFLLQRAVRKLKTELGNDANLFAVPECEFHLIEKAPTGEIRLYGDGSYLASPPADRGLDLRNAFCAALAQAGIGINKHHHESLRGKNEMAFDYDHAVNSADMVMFSKMVMRKITEDHGLIITFMPKPFNVPGGAGWHTHISLMDEKKKKTLMYSPKGPNGLSDLALHFIAGVLKHARALTAVSNPAVNCYKRLVPGYQAPIFASWAKNNRSSLIRIPASQPNGTRFEYRATDGLCNYYLYFTALIFAGLDGVSNKLDPPAPVEENLYALSEKEKKAKGIVQLPRSLGEALDEFEKDEVLKEALQPLTPKFLKLKREEWEEYANRVHDWERAKYMEEYYTRYAEFRESGERVR